MTTPEDRWRDLFNALRAIERNETTPADHELWVAARRLAARRLYNTRTSQPVEIINNRSTAA